MRQLHVLSVVVAILLALMFFFATPTQVYAEDLGTVDCGDTPELLNKIAQANSTIEDDEITLVCASGDAGFLLTDEIDIQNSGALIIQSTSSRASLIQTTDNRRLFHIKNNATLILRNLRLQNGNLMNGNGGAILNRGELRLNDVDIWNSTVTNGNGGAVYNKGEMTVTRSDFYNASLQNGNGAALYSALTSTVTWTDTRVRSNQLGGNGTGIIFNAGAFDLLGGGYSMVGSIGAPVIYNDTTGEMNLDDVRISFNDDAGIENHGELNIFDSEINDNGEQSSGTAGGLENFGIANVYNTDLRNNWLHNAYNGTNATLLLDGVQSFLGNYGVENAGGSLTVKNSVINNVNRGIVQSSGSLSLELSSVSEGIGGIVINAGDVTIYRSSIYDNSGVGITFHSGTLNIQASTISGNQGEYQTGPSTFEKGEGGGVAIYNGNVTITDTTIVENSALRGGGIWVYSDLFTQPNVTLQNTLVAENSVQPNSSGTDIYGPVTLSGVNFIGSSDGVIASGSTAILSGNPLLAPLAANGGTTVSHLPYPNSPLIDTGLCANLSLDQRGISRPYDLAILPNEAPSNGCDIGAVERNSFADAVPTTNSESYRTPYQTVIEVPAPGVLANDSILNTNFVLKLLTDVQYGTLELNTNGAFRYTPEDGFFGTDTFTYALQNNSVVSNIATVVINVSESENVPPVGNIDIYSVEMNNTLNIAAAGVLTNDIDVDSDRVVLNAIKVSEPFNGSVTLNADGSFVYSPSSGFIGSDLFEYRVSDGIFESDPTTVAINVVPVGGLQAFGPAPVNLSVSGNVNRAPVLLTFTWQNTLGDVTPEQWYRLLVLDEDDLSVFDEWFPATEHCGTFQCSIEVTEELLPGGFTNGFYRWKVQSWDAGLYSLLSIEEELNISVATSSLFSTSIDVEVETGRPAIIFPDNVNATWYQLYIGSPEGELYHLRWYEKNDDICEDGVCKLYPDITLVAGNYHLWVQTWGPAGFGLGDVNTEIGGWAGPIEFTIDLLVPGPATPLTPAYVDSGRPEFKWLRANGAIWYQILAYDPTDATTFYENFEWVSTVTTGCTTTLTCTWTPDFLMENNRTYDWLLQGWGPGGYASAGNPDDLLDSWTAGDSFTVNATIPTIPVPITPTGLVTEPVGLTFTWAYDPQVSWYEVEIRQTNTLPITVEPFVFDNWYSADSVQCRESDVCILTIDFLLPNGDFEWRIRAYNPAVTELTESMWSQSQSFTVQR